MHKVNDGKPRVTEWGFSNQLDDLDYGDGLRLLCHKVANTQAKLGDL